MIDRGNQLDIERSDRINLRAADCMLLLMKVKGFASRPAAETQGWLRGFSLLPPADP
jgi:hypothetical protein